MICKSVALRLNLIRFAGFCSSLIFIIIFNYPNPRLPGLFPVVPMSLDNQGLTVLYLCWLQKASLRVLSPVLLSSCHLWWDIKAKKVINCPLLFSIKRAISYPTQENWIYTNPNPTAKNGGFHLDLMWHFVSGGFSKLSMHLIMCTSCHGWWLRQKILTGMCLVDMVFHGWFLLDRNGLKYILCPIPKHLPQM